MLKSTHLVFYDVTFFSVSFQVEKKIVFNQQYWKKKKEKKIVRNFLKFILEDRLIV